MGIMHDQPALNLYEAISDVNINAETIILTVITGETIGEKAMVSGGEMRWSTREDGLLRAHEAELSAVHESGILTAGGEKIFAEILGNEKQVVICGGGHVAMPIVSIARMLGMQVTVIEDREEFAENARRRGANQVICAPFAEGLAQVESDEDTFFVVVTRGHRFDKDCVSAAIRKRHAYVGMIGSRRHAQFVKEALQAEGVSQERIDSIYTPIGLNIGAETPEEIAVAIIGEIIEVKNRKKRNFGFPKDVMKAILSDERGPMILATIVTRQGSAPRGVGSKMLVRADGSIVGTVGGGAAEGAIIRRAVELLAGTLPVTELRHVDLMGSAEDDGMVCGGIVDVLLETV